MIEHLRSLTEEDSKEKNPFEGLAEMFKGGGYQYLTDGQRSRLAGFARFLTLANLGIQWRDYEKRDKDLKDRLEKKLEVRSLVVAAVYSILCPEEKDIPYQMPSKKKTQVQQTVVGHINILYKVSRGSSLSPQELEKIPQITAIMRFLRDDWVSKQP